MHISCCVFIKNLWWSIFLKHAKPDHGVWAQENVYTRFEVSHLWTLLYQEFFEKYFIEICKQNIVKRYKENSGSLFIPHNYGPFNLTFLHLKRNLSLIRMCCQYFWLDKLISSNIIFNYAQWSYWIEGLKKIMYEAA